MSNYQGPSNPTPGQEPPNEPPPNQPQQPGQWRWVPPGRWQWVPTYPQRPPKGPPFWRRHPVWTTIGVLAVIGIAAGASAGGAATTSGSNHAAAAATSSAPTSQAPSSAAPSQSASPSLPATDPAQAAACRRADSLISAFIANLTEPQLQAVITGLDTAFNRIPADSDVATSGSAVSDDLRIDLAVIQAGGELDKPTLATFTKDLTKLDENCIMQGYTMKLGR